MKPVDPCAGRGKWLIIIISILRGWPEYQPDQQPDDRQNDEYNKKNFHQYTMLKFSAMLSQIDINWQSISAWSKRNYCFKTLRYKKFNLRDEKDNEINPAMIENDRTGCRPAGLWIIQ